MSRNLYLDQTTKDLSLTESKNLRLTIDNSEFISQKIENKFSFYLGEWFLNQESGIPFLARENRNRDDSTQNIFVKNPDLNFVNSLFLDQLKQLQNSGEIEDIIKYEAVFDSSERTYTVEFEVKIIGEEETVTGTVTI